MLGLLFTPHRRHAPPMQHRVLSWPVALLIVVLIHLVGGWFASGLHLNNSPEVYYAAGSPAVQVRDELRRSFPNDELLTVVFHGQDLYTVDFLKRLDRFVTALEARELIDRVAAVTSVEKISATSDGFAVGRLIDVKALKRETPAQLHRRATSDRFALGTVASSDSQYLAVVIRPKLMSESSQRLALKIAVIAAVLSHGLGDHYAGDAGPVTMDVAQLQSIFADSAIFVPLTFTLAIGLMWWLVGRWRPVVIGAVAMSTVIVPTIGAIAIAGQPYTMATAILPSLLAAYTSATLLHFYAAVQQGHAAGLSRGRSIDQALDDTLKPGLFNVLTTTAGQLSLIFVPIPPIQVFGIAGALGTVFVFITVFYLVPPFLRHWDSRRWPDRASGLGRFGSLARRLALFSMRHPKGVIGVTVVVLIACAPLMTRLEVESDMLAFFRPEHPVSRHTQLIESKFTGVTSLEVLLVGDGPDSLQSLETLRSIKRFQQWLDKLPTIDRAQSMVDLVEEMHWAMQGEKVGARGALPPTDRLLRQYLLVYDGRDLFELVDRDFQRARILLSLNVHGARGISASIDQIRDYLRANPLPGLRVDIGGYGRLFADQSDLLISGQVNSFASAFLQIFVMMLVLWRSISAASICMVPNLAPLYFVFALMGALHIYIDTASVMIASLVLGITVDDTIHIYHHYRSRLREGAAPVWAIARSFASTGRAVLAIAVLLVSQFALLACSSFIPTSNFGLMTAVGLVSGQVFELLLLPALLLLKDGRKRAQLPARAGSPDIEATSGRR